ncbi:hypothetical protein [Paenibacillus sp. Z6-24]
MNKYKSALLICIVCTAALSGCSKPLTAPSPDSQAASSTTMTKQNRPQVMVDESPYTGEQLEIIRLVNRSIQYTNDLNKEAYMKFFTTDSPIQGIMGTGKITNMEIMHIGDITKTQASLSANVTYENNNPVSKMYTFKKDNNKWLLSNID